MWLCQFIDLLKFKTRPSFLRNFGSLLLRQSLNCVHSAGKHDKAREDLKKSLVIQKEIGDRREAFSCYGNFGIVYQAKRVNPHIGLITKVIPLKLFLDMVPSSQADVTCSSCGQAKRLSRN